MLHGFREMPCDNFFDSESLRFFEDAFRLQEGVEARSMVLPVHDFTSFWPCTSMPVRCPSASCLMKKRVQSDEHLLVWLRCHMQRQSGMALQVADDREKVARLGIAC